MEVHGNPVTYRGRTDICLTAYAAAMAPDYAQSTVVELYDQDGGDYGPLFVVTSGGQYITSQTGERCFAPSAGEHAYSLRLWSTGGAPAGIYRGALACHLGAVCGWLLASLRIIVQ